MTWLVTGGAGMLAADLVSRLRGRGEDVVAPGRADLDVTDAAAVEAAVRSVDVVVNCAAWTAVDLAESEEGRAFAVNALGAVHLAAAAARAAARLVQVSTDYVFDGLAVRPYPVDAAPAPRSAYGRTKLAGEWAVRASGGDHLVVRTAWLYGAGGPCFPRTIARVLGERGGADVVDDQVGQPTWTADLADLVLRLVDARVPAGTYHGTSSGQGSWYDFARAVAASSGLDPDVVRPTATVPGQRPAVRPAFSVLDHADLEAVGVAPIGDWAARWELAAADVLGGAVSRADA